MAMNARELTEAVKAARGEARAEAKASYQWIRSRGTYLCTAGPDQCSPRPEAECPDWDGTYREVLKVVTDVINRHPHVTRIYISGGFDGANTHAELYHDHDYEPWASAWDVTVWTRDGGLV